MKRIYLKRPNRLTNTIKLTRLAITKSRLADSHKRVYEKDTRTSNLTEPPIENSSNWRPAEAFFS